ncbi:MAG TPA: sensor histidine kinase N-terminal domain-containing protein, partial [Roseateles sp.]|nr:sensor histidine kinase N-terminal domain-containing protein [Roseateles sp.]
MWLLPLLLLWALALRIQTLRSEAQSDEAHDRVLLGSALVIAERMAAVDGLLMVDIPPAALQMLEVQAQDRVFYKVSCLAPPAFIAGTPELETDGLPPADATPVFTRARHGDLPVRQVTLRRPVEGVAGCSAASVSVAETRVAREALSRRIMLDATLTQLTLLGGAAALIVFGVRRGLQPLRRLRDEIRGRDEQDLSPIDTGTVPREVVPLIDAINQQMQRQRGVNEAHHRFVADATHQLKTPLAVLRTQAELALGQQDPARMRAYVEELRDGTETTARVVHQLLALLRSDPMALHGVESLDLVEAAREASFELLPLALAKSIDLAFDGGPAAAVRVHGVLLHELVANLVDNA